MGLAAGLKKYLEEKFQDAVTTYEGRGYDCKAEAIVIDAMCFLHSFYFDIDCNTNVIDQLFDFFFALITKHHTVAIAFDQFTTTPTEKHAEWAKRPQPTERIRRETFIELVNQRKLSPAQLKNVIADRELRDLLNTYIAQALFYRMNPSQTLYVMGADDVTLMASNDIVTRRPDLTRPNLGEGDLAVVFLANVLRVEHPVRTVSIETIDTDVIGIAMLHSFPGLFIHTTYKRTHHVFDVHALVEHVPRALGYDTRTFVLLLISRGTDFNSGLIKGMGDWGVYLSSARGSSTRSLKQLLLSVLEKAPRRASFNPKGDQAKAEWVLRYWQNAPSLNI